MERQIPVRELNQHTSAVLEDVAGGHAVTITRDGVPIARIVPVRHLSTSLARLVADGLATVPGARQRFSRPPHYSGADDVAQKLAEDREHERY